MLTSVDDVIEALGGNAAVATLAGVTSPAVSNWRFRREIPAEKFLLITEALKAAGRDATPAIFGFKDPAVVAEVRA